MRKVGEMGANQRKNQEQTLRPVRALSTSEDRFPLLFDTCFGGCTLQQGCVCVCIYFSAHSNPSGSSLKMIENLAVSAGIYEVVGLIN